MCTGSLGRSGIPSLPLSCAGACGPPCRSPRTTESVPRVVAPVAYPTTFLVQQPGNGRQADRAPPRVRVQVGVAHPLHSRLAGGSPRRTRSGREPGPGGRDGGAESFRRGCAAWRALGAHDGRAPCPGSSRRLCGPRRRGPFGTRRVPREPLRTHSIKALSSFLRRAGPDGRLPAQAQHPDLDTLRQRHIMVIG